MVAKVNDPGTLEHLRFTVQQSSVHPETSSEQEPTCFLGPVMSST
jgi:hypothetical protein